mmetsp:Transcript_40057/g.65140  ORF Transcript_40057/g.65140 Transcript_40057/m.65140 type:complete len:700 (+) Transcript_40057:50-2149(+)
MGRPSFDVSHFTASNGGWVCNFCSKKYHRKKNTSKDIDHLIVCKKTPVSVLEKLYDLGLKPEKRDAIRDRLQIFHNLDTASAPSTRAPSTRSRKRKGTTGISHYMDKCTPTDASIVMFHLTRFIVGSALPFDLIKSPYFLDFIEALRPGFVKYVPKCQKTLSTRWLNILNDHVHQRMDDYLSLSPNDMQTLAADGWKNSSNNSKVVNFTAMSSGRASFITSIMQEEKDSVDYHFRLYDNILSSEGKRNVEQVQEVFAAVVSDNVNYMRNALFKVEEKYPKISAIGCASHVCDLLAEDLASRVAPFKEIISRTKRYSSYLSGKGYKAWQKISQSMPCKPRKPRSFPDTRFGYAYLMLDVMIQNQPVVMKMVDSPHWVEGDPEKMKEIQELAKDFKYWTEASSLHALLKPVSKLIAYLGSDEVHISWISPMYRALIDDILEWKERKSNPFDDRTKNYVHEIAMDRWMGRERRVGLCRVAHTVSFALNFLILPIVSNPISGRLRLRSTPDMRNSVCEYGKQLGLREFQIKDDYDALVGMDGVLYELIPTLRKQYGSDDADGSQVQSKVDALWRRLRMTSFYKAWVQLASAGQLLELAKMIKRIDAIKPTAVSVERVNKHNHRIMPKERSSLGMEKVRKSLYCHVNLRMLNSTMYTPEAFLDGLVSSESTTENRVETNRLITILHDPVVPDHVDKPYSKRCKK